MGVELADPRLDPAETARRLRSADPPVIARVHDGRVVLDPRTLSDDEIELVIDAVHGAAPEA